MKTRSFSQSILSVAVVTLLLLLIPLVVMQFTNDVKWGIADFLIIGILLFGAGFSYVLLIRYTHSLLHRVAVGSAIGTTLLLIWANLAVGLIGSGPNPGNLMYIGVLAVVISGTVLSRFTAKGMERTMFAAALSLVVHTGIALLADMQQYPDSSVESIVCVNAFFATLFAGSGLLFRFVARKQASGGSGEMAE